jgi:replication-associated recombination protein RarA
MATDIVCHTLIGPPGSGKTTLAQTMQQAIAVPDISPYQVQFVITQVSQLSQDLTQQTASPPSTVRSALSITASPPSTVRSAP